jgi:hypothetical protein
MLRITIEFSRGGTIMTEDWAAKMAEEFKEGQKHKDQKDAKFLAEENIRRSFGPRLWAELRNGVKNKSHEFNAAMGGEEILTWVVVHADTFTLRRNDLSKELKGQYERELNCISATSDLLDSFRSFQVVVDNNSGTAQLYDSQSKIPMQPDAIAESLLRDFLKRH